MSREEENRERLCSYSSGVAVVKTEMINTNKKKTIFQINIFTLFSQGQVFGKTAQKTRLHHDVSSLTHI